MQLPQQREFNPQIESIGFNPVTPASSTKLTIDNAERQLRDLDIAQSLEKSNLDGVARIKAGLAGKDMLALSEFSKTLGEFVNDWAKRDKEAQEVGAFWDSLFEGFDDSPEATRERQAEEQAVQQGSQQAEQVSRTANSIEEQTGNPALGQEVRQRFGGLAAGIVNERALLMRAQSSYAPYLASWLESNNTFRLGGRDVSVQEALGSGNPAMINAAIAAGRHRFIRENNLQYATKAQFVSILGNTILSTEGTLSATAVRSAIRGQREEQIGQIEGLGYSTGRNSTAVSVDSDFHNLADQFFQQNTGMSRQQANEAAVKALLSGMEDAGNADAIEALLDVMQRPGQQGSELRNRYGNLIFDSLDRARNKGDQLNDRTYNDTINELEANLAGANSAAARQQLIDQAADNLEQQGLYRQARALRNNYQELMVEGGSELNAQQASEAIGRGEITSPNQVNRLVTEGRITRAQGDTLIRELGTADRSKDPTFKAALDQWQDNAEGTFLQAVGIKRDPMGGYAVDPLAGDDAPLSAADAKAVTAQMRRDLLQVATIYANNNPGLSGDALSKGLNAVLGNWVNDNLRVAGGKYQVSDLKPGGATGTQDPKAASRIAGYAGISHLNSSFNLQSNRSLTPVNWQASVANSGGVTPTVAAQFRFNRGDRLFTTSQVKELRDQVKAGKVPQALAQAAQRLGRSPLALLNQQIDAAGLGDSFLVNPQLDNTPTHNSSPRNHRNAQAPTNGVSGAQLLMTRFNVPLRAAAWLSGNLTTESQWNGQRSWDDNGARAGGVASWRAERLAALEAHFGRPVTQIPTNDQLSYLINDLKNNYPNQWRVFTNARSTNRQLLNASYQYWRWGEEGDRANNAVNIEQALRRRQVGQSAAGNPQQRAVQVGRQLLSMGTKMWQHPDFSLDGGFSRGGGQVGGHSPNSYHYANAALDIPLSHNNQAQLTRTFQYLRRNMRQLGIVELFWDQGGYYRDGSSIGAPGSNTIPGHGSHIHVAFG
jgi:hypothetical protein